MPNDFVDLQPGWKVRVVVPILRSGGYVLPSLKASRDGNTANIEAGDEFVGYETAYYQLAARHEGGVRIRFSRVEIWEKGKMHSGSKPRLELFAEAANARHIRLVYLIRESAADHEMAIVAANDAAALDEVTQAVVHRAECANTPVAVCRWVPNGVAVTPEKR